VGGLFKSRIARAKLASVVYNECNNSIGVVAPTVAKFNILNLLVHK
jgi:hypothetical protein